MPCSFLLIQPKTGTDSLSGLTLSQVLKFLWKSAMNRTPLKISCHVVVVLPLESVDLVLYSAWISENLTSVEPNLASKQSSELYRSIPV